MSGTGDLRAARLAAIAALIGALLGAAIPGVFLLTATSRQAAADTDRSRAEFLRVQRQTAYASLVADARALEQLVSAVDERFSLGSSGGDDCPARIDATKRYEALANDVATVELLGSDLVRSEAAKVLQLFSGGIVGVVCVDRGVEQVTRLVHGPSSPASTAEALRTFTEAGRQDLLQ